jgi:hypothetical protein
MKYSGLLRIYRPFACRADTTVSMQAHTLKIAHRLKSHLSENCTAIKSIGEWSGIKSVVMLPAVEK